MIIILVVFQKIIGIGFFDQFGVVQPQEGFTDKINNGSSPSFLNKNLCETFPPFS